MHWGYGRGPFTNRSAGCTVLVGGRFRVENVTNILDPPDALQGRGGAVRLVQGDLNATIIVAYVPPFGGPARKRPAWLRAVQQFTPGSSVC